MDRVAEPHVIVVGAYFAANMFARARTFEPLLSAIGQRTTLLSLPLPTAVPQPFRERIAPSACPRCQELTQAYREVQVRAHNRMVFISHSCFACLSIHFTMFSGMAPKFSYLAFPYLSIILSARRLSMKTAPSGFQRR